MRKSSSCSRYADCCDVSLVGICHLGEILALLVVAASDLYLYCSCLTMNRCGQQNLSVTLSFDVSVPTGISRVDLELCSGCTNCIYEKQPSFPSSHTKHMS